MRRPSGENVAWKSKAEDATVARGAASGPSWIDVHILELSRVDQAISRRDGGGVLAPKPATSNRSGGRRLSLSTRQR